MPRVFIALCCLASLWLSGCSDSSSSSADPPTPSPSSSSPAPSPTEVPETPEAFVRRWVEADTHMQNTGDGADYRRLSKKCPSCFQGVLEYRGQTGQTVPLIVIDRQEIA